MVMNGAESSGGVCYFCCALLKLGLYIVCVSSLSLSTYLCQCMRFQKLPRPSKYTTKAALIQPTIRPTTPNPNPTRMFEHFGKWLANWVTAYNPFAYRFLGHLSLQPVFFSFPSSFFTGSRALFYTTKTGSLPSFTK